MEISCSHRYSHTTTTREQVAMGPVEIITSVQRRRRWTPSEKKAIVEETEQPGMSISSVARKYALHPNQLFTWRRLLNEGALSAVKAGEPVVPASEAKELRLNSEFSHPTVRDGPAPA